MGNIGYIKTDEIFVFPSARRMNKQVSARLMSEASLASIINKLVDTDGFVITPVPETGEHIQQGFNPDEPFEFNVHGYYFQVESAQKIIDIFEGETGFDSIYANIYLDKTADPNYIELAGPDAPLDNNENSPSMYQGLTFSKTDLSKLSEEATNPSKADYSLLLFQKELISATTSDWVVPVLSRLKFYYTLALGVDGGEIKSGDISV